jgi:hypothetical protein
MWAFVALSPFWFVVGTKKNIGSNPEANFGQKVKIGEYF